MKVANYLKEYLSNYDVTANEWYTNAIIWAYENGIIHGYEGINKFDPNDNISMQCYKNIAIKLEGRRKI